MSTVPATLLVLLHICAGQDSLTPAEHSSPQPPTYSPAPVKYQPPAPYHPPGPAPAPYHPPGHAAAPYQPPGHAPAPYHPSGPAPHYGAAHAPQYAPTQGPYRPPHHGAPQHAYGYSPAPPAYGPAHHSPYGYTPAPAYHHAAPAGYHAPVHAPPAPHKPHHEGPPACSKNTTKLWCLEDSDYPAYEISKAIEYNYAGVASLYKDVLANTENSVDRLVELPQETYLCPSKTGYLMPLRAVNTAGKWRIIVNGVNAHYETLTQTARVEECSTAGEACPLVPECYDTKCVQKSIYHRFLVYDSYDHYFPFAMETFKLPSACACHNGAFAESH